ncbi:hypothetical protein Hanom_Chr10g00921311 [Helianthus anomalus]
MSSYSPLEPINLVSPKVMAIAIHPPTKTLKQDFTAGVLPRKAPKHPKNTSANVTAATTTVSLTLWFTMKEAANNGTMAPNANAIADAAAACIGFGSFSFSLSSLLDPFRFM